MWAIDVENLAVNRVWLAEAILVRHVRAFMTTHGPLVCLFAFLAPEALDAPRHHALPRGAPRRHPGRDGGRRGRDDLRRHRLCHLRRGWRACRGRPVMGAGSDAGDPAQHFLDLYDALRRADVELDPSEAAVRAAEHLPSVRSRRRTRRWRGSISAPVSMTPWCASSTAATTHPAGPSTGCSCVASSPCSPGRPSRARPRSGSTSPPASPRANRSSAVRSAPAGCCTPPVRHRQPSCGGGCIDSATTWPACAST